MLRSRRINTPLLDGRNALLLLYTLLDPLNRISWLDIYLNLLACQSFDLDLYT